MHDTQLAQFTAEVLRRGAEAVLPQHLSDHWLDALLEEADMFAPGDGDEDDGAANTDDSDNLGPGCAGLLGAVITLVSEQRGHPTEVEMPVETIMDYLQCYALALAAERVSRSTDIMIDPPTVANIFDVEREMWVKRRSSENA